MVRNATLAVVVGMIGLLLAAAVTEFPIQYSFEISIALGVASLILILVNVEYLTRDARKAFEINRRIFHVEEEIKILGKARLKAIKNMEGVESSIIKEKIKHLRGYLSALKDELSFLRG